jgi:hypothetical protein
MIAIGDLPLYRIVGNPVPCDLDVYRKAIDKRAYFSAYGLDPDEPFVFWHYAVEHGDDATVIRRLERRVIPQGTLPADWCTA